MARPAAALGAGGRDRAGARDRHRDLLGPRQPGELAQGVQRRELRGAGLPRPAGLAHDRGHRAGKADSPACCARCRPRRRSPPPRSASSSRPRSTLASPWCPDAWSGPAPRAAATVNGVTSRRARPAGGREARRRSSSTSSRRVRPLPTGRSELGGGRRWATSATASRRSTSSSPAPAATSAAPRAASRRLHLAGAGPGGRGAPVGQRRGAPPGARRRAQRAAGELSAALPPPNRRSAGR